MGRLWFDMTLHNLCVVKLLDHSRGALMALASVVADDSTFVHENAQPARSHQYLLPALFKLIERPTRIFDLGCGNGAIANALSLKGHTVTGVDPSVSGIREANRAYPHLRLANGSCYDELGRQYGQFPVVVSLEVVEHLYDPQSFASTLYGLSEKGGRVIVSTPYHGYLKNLAIAAAGRFDQHVHPLSLHGHIKFWSRSTLTRLLGEAGFSVRRVLYVGRVRVMAKSMIAVAEKI